MTGTVGTAAALGLALSNVFWDGVFLFVVLPVGTCCLCALAFMVAVTWDMRRDRRRAKAIDSMIPVVAERRQLPDPWALARLAEVRRFDDDTLLADGLILALRKMLDEEVGRNG